LNRPNELYECQNNIAKYRKELDEAKSNPDIIETQTKIESAEKDAKKYQELYNDKVSERKMAEQNVLRYDDEIRKLVELIAEKDNALKQIQTTSTSHFETSVSRFENEFFGKKDVALAIEKIKNRQSTIDKNISAIRESLVASQTKYRNGELGVGPEAMPAYDAEWKKVSETVIGDTKDKIKMYEERNVKQFRESFLAKMKEKIEDAVKIIDNLNKSLDGIYYGEETYKFKIEGNKEKMSLYKMIMSESNVEGYTLFSSLLEEDYRAEMDEFFEKIRLSEDDDSKIAEEFVDYRNYLQYDIISINKSGVKKRLSDNIGHTSGGETQTPCYVALAASFAQAYDVDDDSIRIIMIDEAFNKMDDEKSFGLLKFLFEQNFQLIIATPRDKVATIGDFVDRINVVIKEGGRSTVEDFERECSYYETENS
jgi:uncharacterized protein YPO0396